MSMMRVDSSFTASSFSLSTQRILVLGDLEALHRVTARGLLAGTDVDGLNRDAVVGLGLDQVEVDGLGLGGGRIEGDRTDHQ